jgi:hypothetical protein
MFGAGCTDCPGTKKCTDKLSSQHAIVFECVECGGQKCDTCNQTGQITISRCPLETIPASIWEFIEMATLYLEHGLPPVAGGQLNQAKGFLDGTQFVRKLRSFYKQK